MPIRIGRRWVWPYWRAGCCIHAEDCLIQTSRHERLSENLPFRFQTTSKQGVSRLLLEVRAGNAAAIGLYRKYGFIETGRRKNYYPLPEGGYEDAILMEKPC